MCNYGPLIGIKICLLLLISLTAQSLIADEPVVAGHENPVADAMDDAYRASQYRGFSAPQPARRTPDWLYGRRPVEPNPGAGFKYGLGRHKSFNFSVMPKRTHPHDHLGDDGLGINPATGRDQPRGWRFNFTREF